MPDSKRQYVNADVFRAMLGKNHKKYAEVKKCLRFEMP
jgi:hypothetical protein